jgi:hypothetical protein
MRHIFFSLIFLFSLSLPSHAIIRMVENLNDSGTGSSKTISTSRPTDSPGLVVLTYSTHHLHQRRLTLPTSATPSAQNTMILEFCFSTMGNVGLYRVTAPVELAMTISGTSPLSLLQPSSLVVRCWTNCHPCLSKMRKSA